MAGMLIRFGYGIRGAEKMLDDLMKQGMVLADIRFTPWCNWSEKWNPPALRERYPGRRYWPLRELGNINHNHREDGFKLWKPEEGIKMLLQVLIKKEQNVVIMCGCANFDGCHSRLVMELVAQQSKEIQIWLAYKDHLQRWTPSV